MIDVLRKHGPGGLKWAGRGGVLGLMVALLLAFGDVREAQGELGAVPARVLELERDLAATREELADLRPQLERAVADLAELTGLLWTAGLGLRGAPDFEEFAAEQLEHPPTAEPEGG